MVYAIMQEVVDPKILSQLNATSAPKEVTDPAILAKLNSTDKALNAPTTQPNQSTTDKILAPIDAAATGILRGEGEGVEAMAGLAKSLLSGGAGLVKAGVGQTVGRIVPQSVNNAANAAYNSTSNVLGQASNYVANKYEQGLNYLTANTDDRFQSNATAEHPFLYAAGATLGNVGLQTGALNPIANKASQAIEPALTKASPIVGESPALKGAINQGLVGGSMGVAQNPDHPIAGGLIGATLGGYIGSKAGVIGEQVNRAGSIISKSIEDMTIAGQNPGSLAAIEKIQANLKNQGLVYKTQAIQQAAKAKIESQISELRPQGYTPGTSPINIMMEHVSSNAADVKATTEANYAPINSSTAKIPATSFLETLKTAENSNSVQLAVKNLDLNQPLTLDSMLQQRRVLDGRISQLQAQQRAGKIANDDILPVYQLRQNLNSDIHEGAKQLGLESQLNHAEQYFNTYVRPFQQLDKSGKYVNNTAATTKAMQTIATQLQARRPNFTTIQLASNILGPEGKQLVSWGVVENAFNKATTLSGQFKPTTLQSNLTRLRSSGLMDIMFDSETKQAVNGMSKILEGASRATAGTAEAEMKEQIPSHITSLAQSRSGIQLLRFLGNPSVPTQQRNEMVKQLLTGISVYTSSKLIPRK